MGLIRKLLFLLSPCEVLVRGHGHKRQKSFPPWLSCSLWKSGMHLFRIAYLSWQGGSTAARRDPGASGTREPAHHPRVSSPLLACRDPAQPIALGLPGHCQLRSRHDGICIDLPRAASLARAPPRVARAPPALWAVAPSWLLPTLCPPSHQQVLLQRPDLVLLRQRVRKWVLPHIHCAALRAEPSHARHFPPAGVAFCCNTKLFSYTEREKSVFRTKPSCFTPKRLIDCSNTWATPEGQEASLCQARFDQTMEPERETLPVLPPHHAPSSVLLPPKKRQT